METLGIKQANKSTKQVTKMKLVLEIIMQKCLFNHLFHVDLLKLFPLHLSFIDTPTFPTPPGFKKTCLRYLKCFSNFAAFPPRFFYMQSENLYEIRRMETHFQIVLQQPITIVAEE